jgi:hypothetical protein
MRLKALFSAAVAALLVGGLVASGVPAAAKGKKAKAQVVGKDAAADWGANVDASLAPVGDALGQELVGAAIGMADAKTVNLVFQLNSLPPWGGMPESSRYNWDITVDGTAFQVTGAFTEFIRGTCNPLHTDACPPPQNPGPSPFFVRQGPCVVGEDCYVRGVVSATFDPAKATITVPVPLKLLKAKPGSKIGPGVSTLGGAVYAAPALLVSSPALPNDTMMVTKTFVVPK